MCVCVCVCVHIYACEIKQEIGRVPDALDMADALRGFQVALHMADAPIGYSALYASGAPTGDQVIWLVHSVDARVHLTQLTYQQGTLAIYTAKLKCTSAILYRQLSLSHCHSTY